jgi:putative hydrolase of the HAD superfamily
MIRVVAFDWGDTLMRDDRAATGPMAGWPRVAAIEGAAEALAELAPRHRLVVATNAADSGADLVLAALARVGLDGFFAAVFSSCEVGADKPSRLFFDTMVKRLACAAGEVVMVGDNYANDVIGARAAGLRAVWFNPAGAPCPVAAARHDAEVRALAELPAAIARIDG